MADLNTLFLTFNCGRELISTDFFAASITKGLPPKQLLPPDLIVLSLQEIAPLSQSFLGGSFLAPYFERFSQAVAKAARSWGHDEPYENLLSSNVGMTAIMLFARPGVASSVTRVETGGTGVGAMEMGNKGAVGARIAYGPGDGGRQVEVTFVAAHLAPSEEAWERRNQDWRTINENLVFTSPSQAETSRISLTDDSTEEIEPLLSSATDDQGIKTSHPTDHALLTPASYVFFGGDLNYRTSDLPPRPEDHDTWPSREDPPEHPHHYSHLWAKDQLTREVSAGNTLHGLSEAPVTFEPTYKYSSKARAQAQKNAEVISQQSRSGPVGTGPGETDWLWARHRHPSWCDRIMFLDPKIQGHSPVVHAYTALALQPTSDHKPVALHVSIPAKPFPESAAGAPPPPFLVKPGWKRRRAAARRREVVVGVFAYLLMTWEGRALVLGTAVAILGGWAALRSLLVPKNGL